MPVVDATIDYVINDLNVEISKENQELVLEKFYPDIENKIYWSSHSSGMEYNFYEGIITNDEYEILLKIPPDTSIIFAEIAKFVYDKCKLKDIFFTKDKDKIKKLFDKGFKDSETYYDLMTNNDILTIICEIERQKWLDYYKSSCSPRENQFTRCKSRLDN
jgi:hypothetical protein